jgi:uncharacterized protein (DUF1778 family)
VQHNIERWQIVMGRLKPILVRLDEETYQIVRRVSEARGEKMSVFVRRAVLRELARLSFLPEEEKKALEVK